MIFLRAFALALLANLLPVSAGAFPLPGKHAFNADVGVLQKVQLQLGLSDGMILGVMARNGFTDINITKRKLTKAQAEGCRGGNRYKVEINLDGRVKKEVPIGKCRGVVNFEVARNILQKRGYRQIFMRGEGERFSAVACRKGHRYRIVLNPYGEIANERRIGPCHDRMNEHEIAAMLRARGFSRIRMQPIRRGNYGAEACFGSNKIGLVVNRSGQIVHQQNIGRCDPPIHPATIPSLLGNQGITRVEVVDRQLPRYIAHGCRGNTRLELTLNRFGEITDERGIGRCDPPLTADALTRKLRDGGYRAVRVLASRHNGFTVEACEDAQLVRLELTIFGESINQRLIGDCPSRPALEIVRDYERQGLRGARIYVEGCRRGRRVRAQLDSAGNEINRQVLDRC